jgi:hypothetical protein
MLANANVAPIAEDRPAPAPPAAATLEAIEVADPASPVLQPGAAEPAG